jgi:hypothetical protein
MAKANPGARCETDPSEGFPFPDWVPARRLARSAARKPVVIRVCDLQGLLLGD